MSYLPFYALSLRINLCTTPLPGFLLVIELFLPLSELRRIRSGLRTKNKPPLQCPQAFLYGIRGAASLSRRQSQNHPPARFLLRRVTTQRVILPSRTVIVGVYTVHASRSGKGPSRCLLSSEVLIRWYLNLPRILATILCIIDHLNHIHITHIVRC